MSSWSSWLNSPLTAVKDAFLEYPLPAALVTFVSGGTGAYYLKSSGLWDKYKKPILISSAVGAVGLGYHAYTSLKPLLDELSKAKEAFEQMGSMAGTNGVSKEIQNNLEQNLRGANMSLNATMTNIREIVCKVYQVDAIRSTIPIAKKAGNPYPVIYKLKIHVISRVLVCAYMAVFMRVYLRFLLTVVARYALADSTLTPVATKKPAAKAQVELVGDNDVEKKEEVDASTVSRSILENVAKDVMNISYNLQISVLFPLLVRVVSDIVGQNFDQAKSTFTHIGTTPTTDDDLNEETNINLLASTSSDWVVHKVSNKQLKALFVSVTERVNSLLFSRMSYNHVIGLLTGTMRYSNVTDDMKIGKLDQGQLNLMKMKDLDLYNEPFDLALQIISENKMKQLQNPDEPLPTSNSAGIDDVEPVVDANEPSNQVNLRSLQFGRGTTTLFSHLLLPLAIMIPLMTKFSVNFNDQDKLPIPPHHNQHPSVVSIAQQQMQMQQQQQGVMSALENGGQPMLPAVTISSRKLYLHRLFELLGEMYCLLKQPCLETVMKKSISQCVDVIVDHGVGKPTTEITADAVEVVEVPRVPLLSAISRIGGVFDTLVPEVPSTVFAPIPGSLLYTADTADTVLNDLCTVVYSPISDVESNFGKRDTGFGLGNLGGGMEEFLKAMTEGAGDGDGDGGDLQALIAMFEKMGSSDMGGELNGNGLPPMPGDNADMSLGMGGMPSEEEMMKMFGGGMGMPPMPKMGSGQKKKKKKSAKK